MGSILLIGFLIGMRHAIEADHVAAVASLVNGKQSLAETIRLGSIWGLGHTITLLLFGCMVVFMDTIIPVHLANTLELMVGIMLVILGVDVFRRVYRNKMHYQCCQQTNEQYQKLPLRALLIGFMHGMAGSAAVIILALNTVSSPLQSILYILIFGTIVPYHRRSSTRQGGVEPPTCGFGDRCSAN